MLMLAVGGRKREKKEKKEEDKDEKNLKDEEKEKLEKLRELQQMQIVRVKKGSLFKKIILFILLFIIALIIIGSFLPSIGFGGCIGIIKIEGEISTSSGYGVLSSDNVVSLIREAERRPDILGISIEINSPGGSVVASKNIYYAIKNTKKPVVVYISDIGASGGYLSAIGADSIFADSASITGSIGALATFLDVSSLMQKYGVNATTIKSGEMKDIGDIMRPMSEEERILITKIVDEIFNEFKNFVIEERSHNERFSEKKFEEVLDARILTGKQAYEIGLIDVLGTKSDAIDYLGNITGLGKDPDTCVLEVKRGLLESFFSAMGRGIGEVFLANVNENKFLIS